MTLSENPETNPPDLNLTETAKSAKFGNRNFLRGAIVGLLLMWTYSYNVGVKQQTPVKAFFQILDTISDDFVMGTLLTLVLGVGIVLVFSVTKLYTQIIANIYSFRIIQDLIDNDLRRGHIRTFFAKLVDLQNQPQPETACPTRVSMLLLSLSSMYVLSWIYLVLFSEALFFVSWSAGVDLPINDKNLLLMPTLALAIPFSARVMAYVRYPYAQDYADFMPGAVFVLLVVATLGYLFGSEDQKFFLVQVFQDRGWLYADHEFLPPFIRNGIFLAFIPVFFESGFWLLELGRDERDEEEQEAQALEAAQTAKLEEVESSS